MVSHLHNDPIMCWCWYPHLHVVHFETDVAGSLPDQLDLSSLGKVGLDLEPGQLLGWLNCCLRAVVSAENIRVVKEADVFKEGQQFWSPASKLLSLFSSLIPHWTVSCDLEHKSVYLQDIANNNSLCP